MGKFGNVPGKLRDSADRRKTPVRCRCPEATKCHRWWIVSSSYPSYQRWSEFQIMPASGSSTSVLTWTTMVLKSKHVAGKHWTPRSRQNYKCSLQTLESQQQILRKLMGRCSLEVVGTATSSFMTNYKNKIAGPQLQWQRHLTADGHLSLFGYNQII